MRCCEPIQTRLCICTANASCAVSGAVSEVPVHPVRVEWASQMSNFVLKLEFSRSSLVYTRGGWLALLVWSVNPYRRCLRCSKARQARLVRCPSCLAETLRTSARDLLMRSAGSTPGGNWPEWTDVIRDQRAEWTRVSRRIRTHVSSYSTSDIIVVDRSC